MVYFQGGVLVVYRGHLAFIWQGLSLVDKWTSLSSECFLPGYQSPDRDTA